jgi:hypothetical protein
MGLHGRIDASKGGLGPGAILGGRVRRGFETFPYHGTRISASSSGILNP